ncbi:hypothetical protein [Anaerotignum neopropionicum]|uniref:hypothetical protein n=1 Tax=Anaerotignum neopropionicum TaxID=36847 RepID=UPI00138F107B|nr:hypothetical protein [Anaerotignum neopropionicum]
MAGLTPFPVKNEKIEGTFVYGGFSEKDHKIAKLDKPTKDTNGLFVFTKQCRAFSKLLAERTEV